MHRLTETDLRTLDPLLQGEAVAAASVGRLSKHGCQFVHHPDGTCELLESGLGVWADYLTATLPAEPARIVEVYRRTASTQDLIRRSANGPRVVLTDEQTAGRGRLGRSWIAPPGTAVLMSLTLNCRDRSMDRLSLMVAVAVAQAIEHLTGCPLVQIKWPNDLMVNHRKIAGILIETDSSRHQAIVGIGINVALTDKHLAAMPADLRPHVTSFALCGWSVDRLRVAAAVIRAIDKLMEDSHAGEIVEQWQRRNVLHDAEVRFYADGRELTGTVIDLDPDDGLIVRRTTGELVHLHAATTTIVER